MGQSLSSPSSPSSSSSAQRNSPRRTANNISSHSNHSNNSNDIHHQQDTSSAMGQASNRNAAPMQQQQDEQGEQSQQSQQQQQPSSPSSRVLRSTAERRRRNNLFSNFYPLLSRSSSSSNNNDSPSSGNASPEVNTTNSGRTGSPDPISSASGSSSTAAATRNAASWPERPPSRSGATSPGVTTTRLSTRSPSFQTLPASSLGSTAPRTPRGLSRVQRMYDEQSIRSTRSSSRASSLAAVSPPVHPPSSISAPGEAVEYMDIDPESVGVTAQHYQPPSQSQTRPVMRPSALSQSALSPSSGLVTTAAVPTASTAAPIRESGPRTRSSTATFLPESTSASSTVGVTATGSDSRSLFSGLSNPRGGTSISSSLFPIRPDSDDENDDMDRDVTMDRDQQQPPSASLVQHPQGHTHTHAHTHGRRIAAPDLFAHIMMSLQESTATTGFAPSSASSSTQTAAASEDITGATSVDNGQQDQDSLTGAARRPTTATPSGRTRLRSSSMRGLFGHQPTNELADEERPSAAASSETGATAGGAGADTEAGAPRGDRNAERLSLQIPFFLRLLAEISRMPLNNPDEAGADQTDTATATDRPAETIAAAATTDGSSQHTAHSSRPATATPHGTDSFTETTPENGAPPRLRRPNTTIRLIQFGHGVRHPRPTGAHTAPSAPTGTVGATGATGEEQGETEGREGHPAVNPSEESNDTFIMFLSGPPPDDMDETEPNDSTAPGSDDPESARTRSRQRSPWVVLTLSGAYLNSMMTAGADGEGGSTYDDLWMLANLIGPARPITTTQEAIDNAGFAVGRFEQALQGMRNVPTLGDGTKCLVCMSEYEEGEDMRALKCHHGFHQECIDKWLTTGANKCPVCRAAAVVTESPMAVEPEVSVNPSEE